MKGTKSIRQEMKRLLAVFLVLFALLCMAISFTVWNILKANTREYMEVTARQSVAELDTTYEKLENYTLYLAADQRVQTLLTEPMSEKIGDISYFQSLLAQYRIGEPAITDISLISDNMVYSSIYTDEEMEEISDLLTDNSFCWLGVRQTTFVSLGEGLKLFVYGKHVVTDGRVIGTIVISLPTERFSQAVGSMNFCQAVAASDGSGFYLLDDVEGHYESMETAWMQVFGNSDSDLLQTEEAIWKKTGKYDFCIFYLEKMNCFLLSSNTMGNRYISGNMRILQIMIWGCTLLVAAAMLAFLQMVNRSLVKPIWNFYGTMKEIRATKKRHFEEQVQTSGCLEIQEMEKEFYAMLQDIDRLNHKIFDNATRMYELELKKQQAQLSYLRGQVDPHFLYNTLETLRQEAIRDGAGDLAQMAVDMGNIFRYSAKGSDLVTLAQETAVTRAYVRIQEKRFRGRLRFFCLIPENLQNQKVMKMILQPLVENAVVHGIEPKEKGGSVFVGVHLEEGALLITVKDDGVGIPAENLEKINRQLEDENFDTSRHVGIFNTQARIRMMYGKEYGIRIESSEEDGTNVFVRIPAGEGAEEYVSGIAGGR